MRILIVDDNAYTAETMAHLVGTYGHEARFAVDAEEAMGLLEKLLAGGRRAKLWELYEKRFREIAESAETRFLGEVGADFRDAYETEEK